MWRRGWVIDGEEGSIERTERESAMEEELKIFAGGWKSKRWMADQRRKGKKQKALATPIRVMIDVSVAMSFFRPYTILNKNFWIYTRLAYFSEYRRPMPPGSHVYTFTWTLFFLRLRQSSSPARIYNRPWVMDAVMHQIWKVKQTKRG